MKTLYIDLDNGNRVSSTLDTYTAPELVSAQSSPIEISFAFHRAGVIDDIAVAQAGRLYLAQSTAVGGTPPLATGSQWAATGSDTSARYVAKLEADNASVRAAFAAVSQTASFVLQLVWIATGNTIPSRSTLIPVTLSRALDLPNGSTPNPLDETEDADLFVGNRAVRYDAVQTLTEEEKAQALDNLGLNNTLSYQPYTIAVAAQQVPGVRTEETLQAALDVVAASPSIYRTIRIVEVTGAGLVATATAFTIDTLRIMGAESIDLLDLSAASVGQLITDCSFSELVIADADSAQADHVLTGIGGPRITMLTARGVRKNTGSSPVFNTLFIRGGFYIDEANLSGADGVATNGNRNACNGRNVEAEQGCYVGGLDQSGGEGAVGDVGDSSGNGGHGGWPGNYVLGAMACIEYAAGVVSVGGAGGNFAGSGTAGDDHTGDASTGTVHASSTVIP